MRAKKLLTSRQIFRYAVPARTVTKKHCICGIKAKCCWSSISIRYLRAVSYSIYPCIHYLIVHCQQLKTLCGVLRSFCMLLSSSTEGTPPRPLKLFDVILQLSAFHGAFQLSQSTLYALADVARIFAALCTHRCLIYRLAY